MPYKNYNHYLIQKSYCIHYSNYIKSTKSTTSCNEKNRIIHRKYKSEADKIKNFSYGGRLADYAYYDMDMTISAALKKFHQGVFLI